MKKKILLLIGTILLLILLVFITCKIIFKSKQIELTYKSNGGVPYKWEYIIEDESIVKFVRSYVLEDKNDGTLVGAPIYTNYVFKGLKKGRTKIKFQYINFVDGTIGKEEVVNVLVDKNKNISIYMKSK